MAAHPPPASTVSDARLKRQWMGLLSYLMFLPVLVVSVEHGWVDFGYPGLLGFTLAAVGTNLAFYVAIRNGHTHRFRDPSLLLQQIGVASLLALLMGYYTGEARLITLTLLFTAFFFGVFNLRVREYLVLTAMVVVGYAAMLAFKYPNAAQRDSGLFRIELLHFGVLVMILLWISLLGSYVSQLRSRLEHKRNALSQALERLQTLASHDELTGVFNRRRLMEMLDQQRERALRHGEAFSVCLFDLDHFKQLNDRHGHQAGDEALRGFSAHIETGIRRIDVFGRADADTPGMFGRYGGEEFLLLLPHTGLDEAARCVERLRDSMHGTGFATAAGAMTLTFSAGVAQYHSGESVMQLLQRADTALYGAKHDGRDRVGIAD